MVAKNIPSGIEWIIEIPLDSDAQIVQPPQQREHLSADGGRLDGLGVQPVFPRDLSGKGRGDRPVAGALGVADPVGLGIDPPEVGIRGNGRGLAFLACDHVRNRPPHDLLQRCPDTVCICRRIRKFRRHVSLSRFQRGQQVGRPLYRAGEDMGA
nr:hypothetical protein [Oceaniglobus indicus]